MSRILYGEDGEEVEVPTDEEIKELQTKAEAAGKSDEFNKMTSEIRKTLDLKEDEDLLEAIKLAKESTNPNFKALRSKISRYESFIKTNIKDAEFDQEGNVINKKEKFNMDDITTAAKKVTLETMAEHDMNRRMSKYPEDKRAVVRKYFDKLATGEDMTPENVDRFISEAERLAQVPDVRTETRFNGGEPKLSAEGAKFVESPKGKEAAQEIFGDEAFSKPNQANK